MTFSRERLFAAHLVLSAWSKAYWKHTARLEWCLAFLESLSKCLQLPLESPGAAGTQMLKPLLQECLSLLLWLPRLLQLLLQPSCSKKSLPGQHPDSGNQLTAPLFNLGSFFFPRRGKTPLFFSFSVTYVCVITTPSLYHHYFILYTYYKIWHQI